MFGSQLSFFNDPHTITDDDIDSVLLCGSGMYHGKYRIYDQLKTETDAKKNIKFLKEEYGVGGRYPCDGDMHETHDARGIHILRGTISKDNPGVIVSWEFATKRIADMIQDGCYLSVDEQSRYPSYREELESREERTKTAMEFRDIVDAYNGMCEDSGDSDNILNRYYMCGCWTAYSNGEDTLHYRTAAGDQVVPMMVAAMEHIIADGTPLTQRCRAMIEKLS